MNPVPSATLRPPECGVCGAKPGESHLGSTPDVEGAKRGIDGPECCVRYVRCGLDLLHEWNETPLHDDEPMQHSFREAHQHMVAVLKEIVAGERCPWHDEIPEDYLGIMKLMGGSDGR